MTKKMFDKVLEGQKSKAQKAADDAMEHICDHVCRHPIANLSADEFEKRCEKCTVHLEIRKAMDRAELVGKIAAYANVSTTCEELTEEEI